MFRKRTWIMGFMAAVLLTLTMGQNNDGTTFNCRGECTGDACD